MSGTVKKVETVHLVDDGGYRLRVGRDESGNPSILICHEWEEDAAFAFMDEEDVNAILDFLEKAMRAEVGLDS